MIGMSILGGIISLLLIGFDKKKLKFKGWLDFDEMNNCLIWSHLHVIYKMYTSKVKYLKVSKICSFIIQMLFSSSLLIDFSLYRTPNTSWLRSRWWWWWFMGYIYRSDLKWFHIFLIYFNFSFNCITRTLLLLIATAFINYLINFSFFLAYYWIRRHKPA